MAYFKNGRTLNLFFAVSKNQENVLSDFKNQSNI